MRGTIRVLAITLTTIVLLVPTLSCSSDGTILPPPEQAEATPAKAGEVDTVYWENKLMDNTWMSPAEVDIGNFYPGARAEWEMRIHNGNKFTTEKYSVTTDPGETTVPIKLKQRLQDGNIANVTILASDNSRDKLEAIGYKDGALIVQGFSPNDARIIVITYRFMAQFMVKFSVPSNTKEGFVSATSEAQDWVIIVDATPVLAPKETRNIMVALEIPKDAKVPFSRWEFWIIAYDTSQSGQVTTQLASRWCVTMR